MAQSVNFIVVGSGVAGSFIANAFASQGVSDVLVLEAGPVIPMGDPGWWFHHVAAGGGLNAPDGVANTPYAACYDEQADFVATGTAPWNIIGSRIFGGGGTTLHWGGWTPRFKPEDFALYTNTGQGIDWPFSYDDLEPYYCDAEQYLGVSGDSTVNDPPRSQPLPYGPAPYPISAGPFINAFDSMGIGYEHLAVARYGAAHNGNGPCRTTGTCNYCPVGGRFTGDQPLATAQASTGVTVIFNAAVVNIRMASKQRAAGVTYIDTTTGASVDVDALAIIICTGALEAPKLLLNSVSSYWPTGVGNDADLVGRFLSATQFFYAAGVAPNTQGFEEELGFPSLSSRAYDTPAQQKAGKLFLSMNYETPNLDVASLMAQGLDVKAILSQSVAPASFQLYGNMSCIPQYQNRVTPISGSTRFQLPRTSIATPQPLYDPTAAANYCAIMENLLTTMGCGSVQSGTYPQRGDHAACTTRMATDASQGVVNTEFQVFGVDNLFIVGNSAMPTIPAANPTLTLVAMMQMIILDSATALGKLLGAPPRVSTGTEKDFSYSLPPDRPQIE
jgi:choline dehydrogenase-like flavoprotein